MLRTLSKPVIGRAARSPGVHPLRQRLGVYRQGPPEVARRREDQDDLHRAGQSVAEWLRGILPQSLPRRVPEPRAALDADRGTGGHRGLPHRLQYAAPPTVALSTAAP